MTTLIFATNNQHKIDEIKFVVGNKFNIVTLQQAGINTDIPEPHPTIEENATEKATFIYNLTQQNCFGEDTGLEVEALNGEPGVLSARYGGEEKSHQKNMEKLLLNLQPFGNKNAQFKTVISLMYNGQLHLFTGICKGTIIATPIGNEGFGYDPIFIPEGSDKTFAQMTIEEKNKFSHRKKATQQLLDFLNTLS